MMRKLLPGLVAACAVALIAGGAVLAFGGGGDGSQDDLLSDVALRLGLDPARVEEAFAQAKREQTDEQVAKLLTGMVHRELISQDQAGEALAWFGSRPGVADKLWNGHPGARLLGEKFRGGTFIAPHGPPFDIHGPTQLPEIAARMADKLGIGMEELEQAFSDARSGAAAFTHGDAMKAYVERLLSKDVITEAEATELKAWIDGMPSWLANGNLAGRSIFRPRFGRSTSELCEKPGGLEMGFFGAPDHAPKPRFEFELKRHRLPFPDANEFEPPVFIPGDAGTGVSRSA